MNCVLMMNMRKKRVSKQNDDIKAESSTKRGYMNGLKYCIHARAVPHTNTSPISRPPHATGVTSLPRTTNSLSAPVPPSHFTNEILKEKGRKTKLKEYSLEESIRESPPALLDHSPTHPVTSVVFKMFSFLTMKYIPQTAF